MFTYISVWLCVFLGVTALAATPAGTKEYVMVHMYFQYLALVYV